MHLPRLLAAAAALTLAAPALAQSDGPPADTGGDRLTVAVGIGFAPSYEGSNDTVVIPAGAIDAQYKGYRIFTRQTYAYIDVIPERDGSTGVDFELGPVAGVRLNRNSRIVDPQVRALGRRDAAIEVGGFAGISKTGVITSAYDSIGARVTVLTDVAGAHRSTIIQPSVTYFTPLSQRAAITLAASADFVERGYAQAYFGVDAAGSARSGLPVFSPRGGLKSYSISALALQSLSGDLRHGLNVFALGSYTRLLNDFSYSPVVRIAGSPNQWFGAVGIGYTF